MSAVYSTGPLAPAQRFGYWHDVVCRQFVQADSGSDARDDFAALLSVRALGPLAISEMRAPSHHWHRRESHIRRDDSDDFLLSLMIEGQGRLSQGGRQVVQRAGDLVLYDTARPFDFELAPRSNILVKIPREALVSRLLTPRALDALTAVRLGAGTPAGPLLARMLVDSVEAELAGGTADLRDRPTQPSGGRADLPARWAAALLDMLSLCLEMQGLAEPSAHATETPGRTPATRDALRARISRWLSSRLDDPTLSIESIARAHGISPRTLLRTFAQNGTTPMRWLWRQRLEASRRALVDRRVNSVTDAALQSGFSDMAHFSRSFRQAFGVSPHALLRGQGDER